MFQLGFETGGVEGDTMGGKTLTRADLSEAVHREVGLSRTESAELVKSIIDTVAEAVVSGDRVKLSSFGTFMVRDKGGRVGRNPKTGEEVPITPRRVLVFRPSQVMKSRINNSDGGEAQA
jgi:integration host factor subunit alpha